MSTRSRVTTYVIDTFAKDLTADELLPDADLRELGIINSLGLVRLVGWIGETFDIPVAEIDFDPGELSSVENISTFVSKHSAAESPV